MIDTSRLSQASTTSTDLWDQPSDYDYSTSSSYPTGASTKSQRKNTQKVVPDDWDNDEDEEQDSAKVWEDANNKTPMPELIISPSSTGTSVVPPPPAAFQPAMRILKRPSPSQSPSNSTISFSSLTRNTLAEREAQYHEARNRIFGTTEETVNCGDDLVRSTRDGSGKGPGALTTVLRSPIGPSDLEKGATKTGDSSPPKGFRDRRNGRSQNSSSSNLT